MKKLAIILLSFIPVLTWGQSGKVTSLPVDASVDTADVLYIIDLGTTSKQMKMARVLDVLSDTANAVRSEMADSIADLRGQISSGSAGWTYDGSVMHLTTNSDSVGIGTSAPTEKLEVVGNIKASGSLTVDGITNTGIMTNDTAVYLNYDYSGVNSQYLRFGLNNRIRNFGGALEFTDNSGTYTLSTLGKTYSALSGVDIFEYLPGYYYVRLGGILYYDTELSAGNYNVNIGGNSGEIGITPHVSSTSSYYMRSFNSTNRSEIKNTNYRDIRMVSNSKSAGDSTVYLLSHEEAEWDFTGEKITMSADELEVPANYTINTPALAVSDTLKFGDGWLYNSGSSGTYLGAPNSRYMRFLTLSIFGDTYYGIRDVGYLKFEKVGGQDYMAGFRSDTTRSTNDTAIAPSWDGLRKYVAANGGGGSVDNIDISGTNTFVGIDAGESATGDLNTFYGYESGRDNTTGYRNNFIGSQAGQRNTSGYRNNFIGYGAGLYTTTGSGNNFVGSTAGGVNTTGYSNNFSGDGSGGSNTTGYNNVFVGAFSGYTNTTGSGNVYIGHSAGYTGTRSNTLYIENSNSSSPLIYGDFSADSVKINGDLNVTGNVYMGSLVKSDTTWIMVTPTGKLIPGDSITFASQGLTDKLVPIEKYLSDVVDGELLWTWYDHTGRPWTIRGTGGTSPDKALNALTWQAEHLLRYNLALEKKVNGLIGLVVLLAGVIVIYGFILIRRK